MAILQEIYQIPLVRDLVNDIPNLIQKGIGWISSLIKPAIHHQKRKSYVEITEVSQAERHQPKIEQPLRQPHQLVIPQTTEHIQRYTLDTQNLQTVQLHDDVVNLRQQLDEMREQVKNSFIQLAQTQEEFHVTQMLQTMILQAINTNLQIRLEQEGYLDHLMHILAPAQQGINPNQVHQQIQHLLALYHREGVDIYPADPPITVSEVTQEGMIQLNVRLLTAIPKQWTMYRTYNMPRKRGAQSYRARIPFKYVLVHHQLREYIPLEDQEAQDCLSRICCPTAPQRHARTGPCAIKRLLNREVGIEECVYDKSERNDMFVSTQHGLAYAVHQTTTANIHCLQTDHQPEVMRSITLSNWGTIETTPGCYIETETQ